MGTWYGELAGSAQMACAFEGVPITNQNQKSRPDLFMPRAHLLAGDVLAFGDKKHPGAPWLKMSIADHLAASQRHYLQWQTGDTADSESGQSHLVHALVRLAMAVELEATS